MSYNVEDYWGKNMKDLYENELKDNIESDLWGSAKPMDNISPQETELSYEEEQWGKEMHKLYKQELHSVRIEECFYE